MKRRMWLVGLFGFVLLFALLIAVDSFVAAQPSGGVVAFDMVGSASQNLISYTDDPAIPFTSASDGFNKFQRGVSASVPYSIQDDSAGSYAGDTLGIIKTGNVEEFFGVTDTVNGDTGTRDVAANWVFDISGASGLMISIDMGAMGDFEATDFFNWSYSIDGGSAETAFQNSVDETGTHTYTMESGTQVVLNDPMYVNGVLLDNDLQTHSVPIVGTGDVLSLTLTVNTDGGSEAMAFQNLIIQEPPLFMAFDMVNTSSQNLISYTDDPAIPFTSAGDGFNKFQRGVSASIPYSIQDDSAGSYAGDTLGIIKTGNVEEFFGVTDTVNGDTGTRDVAANWVFDISGASGLMISIDMGAMGDFEATDFFNWSYSIDGGSAETAFQNSVDETGTHTYTMESGTQVVLNDPMYVNGVLLDNDLQTHSVPIVGTGDVFSLTLTVNTDGGSEAMAFQNLIIQEPPPFMAYDMVNSTSQNLIKFTDDPAIPFSSPADAFNKLQRGVSASLPFDLMDDSAGSYPPDTQGIIKTGNVDGFFGISDTYNDDTGGRDVVATWLFNIGGATDLGLSIDMGAMGDFETSDFFTWSYIIDGGVSATAFQSSVDDSGRYTYTMESGTEVGLNDPMYVNGLLLNNNLQTHSADITGTGSVLELTLTANSNGGGEAIAFQNVVIEGSGGTNVFPPVVVGTSPVNGADFVALDVNVEIGFSESVTTTTAWYDFMCGPTPISASVSGGPEVFTLDPVSDLSASTVCTVTVLAEEIASIGPPSIDMVDDYSFSFTTAAACGDPAIFIHEVQGPGASSPLEGQTVTIEGVVVGDFQSSSELNGFFVQEEDADFDGDPDTSEGVFVYESSFAAPNVVEGDLVRVTGVVDEYKGLTQLSSIANVSVCDTQPGSYGPVIVTLPENTNGDLEKVEGMNVTLTQTMSVAQNYFLGRYGQLTLSSDLAYRLYNPTNLVEPNSPESAALFDYNARNLLFLDDGVDASSCGDNPVPVPYIGAAPPDILRGGDQVDNLTGVLDYGQINSAACSSSSTLDGRDYRLHPTVAPLFTNTNVRTAAPADVGGDLTVVAFNVLNFFNGDGQGGGFPTSRGADTYNEFVRQRIKIFEALIAIDGDIVGLMEIENDGFDQYSAIAELVKVLNEGPCYDTTLCTDIGYTGTGLGAGTYAYIDAGPGPVGTDEITQGYIYKPASVIPAGNPVIVDEAAFTDPNGTGSERNRPAIVQTFVDNDGGIFSVIVNHLKSKGSSCGAGDDDPEQGNCNVTRALAAEYLADTVVPAVQSETGDLDVIIIGDMNAYAMEDPIAALELGGFTNIVTNLNGVYQYSYTFDGAVGTLDYALGNSSLFAQVTGATIWHINTDEPVVTDYDENYNPPGYWSPDPYRASDHDPVIVGISLAPSLASFTSNSPVVIGSLSVFTNTTSARSIITYEWDFGDFSATVTDTNPTHLYEFDGTYTVTLSATSPAGTSVYSAPHVVLPEPPVAGFTSNSPVYLPSPAVFVNTTVGAAPISYAWDFGDGSAVVSDLNPIHDYATYGTYTVVLTATNLGGTDVYTDTVQVFEPQDPTSVNLSDLSGASGTGGWLWILAVILMIGIFVLVVSNKKLAKQRIGRRDE